MISPSSDSRRASVQLTKHWVSSSGLSRDRTRRKVSCDGMPWGSSKNCWNHSAWAWPYSSMSSQPSAPLMTAHRAMTKISNNRCRAFALLGSLTCAKESNKRAEAGSSIGIPSPRCGSTDTATSENLEKECFQFSNALTLYHATQRGVLSPLVCYRTVIFQKPTAERGRGGGEAKRGARNLS